MRSVLLVCLSCLMAAGVLFAIPATLEAQVTVLTVGPDGAYPDIQGAIDAVVAGQDTEVRIQGAQTYLENLQITEAFSSGALTLLGGWDSTFTERVFLPVDTIIDGDQAGRVLDAFDHSGDLVVDGLTFTNGLVAGPGGGMRIDPAADSQVTLSNVRIIGNVSTVAGANSGGGLHVELFGVQQLELSNCSILDNAVGSTGGGVVAGGGLSIRATGDSTFLIQGCEIERNVVDSAGQIFGAGIKVETSDNAQGQLLDAWMVENSAVSADVWAAGAAFETRGESILTVERSAIALNTVIGDTAAQLWSSNSGLSVFRMRDSIIGLGEDNGLEISAGNHGVVNLVNLTIADNLGVGIDLGQSDLATITLYNSISYGNASDLRILGAVEADYNLIGLDPNFVDPAVFDYHLAFGSVAENAGLNTPPGGLGLIDFDGNSRILDGVVDLGCFEGIGVIFASDFELGDTSTWSGTMP